MNNKEETCCCARNSSLQEWTVHDGREDEVSFAEVDTEYGRGVRCTGRATHDIKEASVWKPLCAVHFAIYLQHKPTMAHRAREYVIDEEEGLDDLSLLR